MRRGRKLYSFKVPLLNGGKRQQPQIVNAGMTDASYMASAMKFGSMTVTKPPEKLGAIYIDDKAHNVGTACLCDSCVEKYWGFWKKTGHRPNWGYYFTGHCDGCGERYILCTLFVQDAMFRQVLAPNHGRAASPKRKLFRLPWRF